MKRTTRVMSAVLAGMAFAGFVGGVASAASAPAPAAAAAPAPTTAFHPPKVVAGTDLLSVQGAAGSDQNLRIRGTVGTIRVGDTVVVQPGSAAAGGLLVTVKVV